MTALPRSATPVRWGYPGAALLLIGTAGSEALGEASLALAVIGVGVPAALLLAPGLHEGLRGRGLSARFWRITLSAGLWVSLAFSPGPRMPGPLAFGVEVTLALWCLAFGAALEMAQPPPKRRGQDGGSSGGDGAFVGGGDASGGESSGEEASSGASGCGFGGSDAGDGGSDGGGDGGGGDGGGGGD